MDSSKPGVKTARPRLCFIGNMLGRNAGYVTTQGLVLSDLFASDGYEVVAVSSKINRITRFCEIFTTLVTQRRTFDLVLLETYSGLYFLLADAVTWLCRVFGIPSIAILHGGALPGFARRFPKWTSRALDRVDALVAPSYFLAKEFGTGREIEVIPNVIEIGQYPYRERSHIRPNLIWMRSFHPIYNPEMAIEVLAKLRVSEPNATLTMAGSDKGLEESVRFKANVSGVAAAVRFVGFLDQKSKIRELATADIYLNTNRTDNMPVSVIEARAMGLPVISTNVGGLSYLIDDEENGFLVPSEDSDAMVLKIQRLLDDRDTTLKISRNGRSIAEASAWTSVRPAWEQLMARVLEGSEQRDVPNSKTSTNVLGF